MVDLKANPYHLSDEDIAWVKSTIAGMTDEEKVGQLFFQLAASQEESYLKELMEKYHLGGCRYNPMPGIKVLEQNRLLQKYARIPVIIACNPEQGGGEVPWYVHELPVIGISVNKPTMLADVPMLRTYINTYDANDDTMDALADALVAGPDAFKGKDPIDSYCGMWDTRM